VPAVVISPWIDQLTIDSTQYEHSSIAATARKLFLGDAWQSKFLNNRDKAANTFDRSLTRDTPRNDVVDFNHPLHAAALARSQDVSAVAARTAKNASLPLSDLQKAAVMQTHFVNLTLPPEQQSDTQPHEISTEREAAAFHKEVTNQVVSSNGGGKA